MAEESTVETVIRMMDLLMKISPPRPIHPNSRRVLTAFVTGTSLIEKDLMPFEDMARLLVCVETEFPDKVIVLLCVDEASRQERLHRLWCLSSQECLPEITGPHENGISVYDASVISLRGLSADILVIDAEVYGLTRNIEEEVFLPMQMVREHHQLGLQRDNQAQKLQLFCEEARKTEPQCQQQ